MIEIFLEMPMELKILFLGSFVLIVVEAIKKHRQERKRQERLDKIKWQKKTFVKILNVEIA